MLDKDTIAKIKQAQELNSELYKQGFISINPYENEVLMNAKRFYETFERYAIKEREGFGFPLELSKIEGGIKFITVLNNKEALKELPLKEREAV